MACVELLRTPKGQSAERICKVEKPQIQRKSLSCRRFWRRAKGKTAGRGKKEAVVTCLNDFYFVPEVVMLLVGGLERGFRRVQCLDAAPESALRSIPVFVS